MQASNPSPVIGPSVTPRQTGRVSSQAALAQTHTSLGILRQSALVGSNVNVDSELINMNETQRAYEMNSKAISTNDQMMQYVNNNL